MKQSRRWLQNDDVREAIGAFKVVTHLETSDPVIYQGHVDVYNEHFDKLWSEMLRPLGPKSSVCTAGSRGRCRYSSTVCAAMRRRSSRTAPLTLRQVDGKSALFP